MSTTEQAGTTPTSQPSAPVYSNLLQLKCACGGAPGVDGECAECRKKRLQRSSGGGIETASVPPVSNEGSRSVDGPPESSTSALAHAHFGHYFGHVSIDPYTVELSADQHRWLHNEDKCNELWKDSRLKKRETLIDEIRTMMCELQKRVGLERLDLVPYRKARRAIDAI